MKRLFFSLILMGMTVSIFAQADTYSTPEESDPKAKAILESLKNKYEQFKTIQADFTLIIEIPEEDRIVQKGKMAQAGDKYRLELEDQSIMTDGETLWYYQKNNNEVQVNSADDWGAGEDILTPSDILKMYESGEYIYVLVDEYSAEKTIVQQIEFKPAIRDSKNHSKLRLTVDKKANTIKEMKAFQIDGTRYTLRMDEFVADKAVDDSQFTFNVKDYPDIHVEEMRF